MSEEYTHNMERVKNMLWSWVQYYEEQKTGLIIGTGKPHMVISGRLANWYNAHGRG